MIDNTNTEIMVAGAIAAFTIDLLMYPIDTIKTRYQSQDYVQTFAASGSGSKPATRLPVNLFKGLYQGVGSVIVATLPAAGIFFTTYESAKSLYSAGAASLPPGLAVPLPVIHSLASGTAELASCVVLTPAEVIKQNAQMLRHSGGGGSGSPSTSVAALRMLWRHDGAGNGGPARRLWSGYTALAARNLPFTAMQFPLFEFFRGRLWEWREQVREGRARLKSPGIASGEDLQNRIQSRDGGAGMLWETGLVTGASAGASGALAGGVTGPADVVKTRMMLEAGGGGDKRHGSDASGERNGSPGPRRRPGAVEIAKKVYKERGVRGLFRGGLLRAVWTAAGSGLYLGTYEVVKLWLKGGKGDPRELDL